MPKRVKQSSRPMDINQAAFRQVAMATEGREPTSQPRKKKSASPKVTKSDISRVMAALGRKGGKKGGKRRLETMTPEERSKIALQAAKARWSKEKQQD